MNTASAVIDCRKENFFTNFAGESYEFNFSKFAKVSYETELHNENFKITQLASVALAPNMSCLGRVTPGVKDTPFLGSAWGTKEDVDLFTRREFVDG